MRIAVILLLLLSACATHQAVPEEPVSNPWQLRAQSLARSGVDAMGREQWLVATSMFERSLRAATLAGDDRLVALAWYNIGRASASAGHARAAREAYMQAMRQADISNDGVNRRRAALAIAMLDGDASEGVDAVLAGIPASDPIDVHLAAAALSARTGRIDAARRAYVRVLQMATASRVGRLYAARAELGLAELDATSDAGAARRHLDAALEMLQRAGQPRLMLQAMQLATRLEADDERRQQWWQRAEALRRAMLGEMAPAGIKD